MTLEVIERMRRWPPFSGFGGADKPESDSYNLSTEEKTTTNSSLSLVLVEAASSRDEYLLSKIRTLVDPQEPIRSMHLISKVRQQYIGIAKN